VRSLLELVYNSLTALAHPFFFSQRTHARLSWIFLPPFALCGRRRKNAPVHKTFAFCRMIS
jgi:hypothetical protein